jgi:guanylate kinase
MVHYYLLQRCVLYILFSCSIDAVESVRQQGKICILDIDVQGVRNVKKSTLDAIYVFIAPPSMEELEKRLRGRGTESEEAVLKRLENAKEELDYGMGVGNFDRVFTNDNLDKTFKALVEQFKQWYPQFTE